MFGIGGFELFIIIVFAILVFGPSKMPEATKYAGRAIKKIRKAKAEMDKVVQEEIVEPVMKVANEPDDVSSQNKSLPKTSTSDDSKKTNYEGHVSEGDK